MDELNKNANAVIDRGCQDEIKKISPEGEKLAQSSLKLAILSLNSKLTVSAYEILPEIKTLENNWLLMTKS